MGCSSQYHVHVGHCKRRAPSYGTSDVSKTPGTFSNIDLLSLSLGVKGVTKSPSDAHTMDPRDPIYDARRAHTLPHIPSDYHVN